MRDIITNIYRVLLELLHDVRHRALVYALEPVEVVGLAVACGVCCMVAAVAYDGGLCLGTRRPDPRPSARCDQRRPSSA